MLMNMMKEKSLRKKIWFTLFVLAVASALTQIPVIGLNQTYMNALFSSSSVLSFIDTMSGGSLSNLSVAAFGITSYITASILLQLIAVIFPKFEMIRRDGEQGRKLNEKINFVLAMVITLVSGTTLSIAFGRSGMFVEYSVKYMFVAIISWLLASFVIIFLGQKVEEYGVGNGITLILGFNILSRIPNNIISYYKTHSDNITTTAIYMIGLVVALFVFYWIAVYLQTGLLNIPIKQTRKQASFNNVDGVVPISVNISNVLPVIYATSLISFPALIITLFGINVGDKGQHILSILSSANWYHPEHWYQPLGLLLYIALIIVFGFFSSELSFNSSEIADHLKKNGNVIPGINPGTDTITFLEKRRKMMSFINVLFLLVIAIVPDAICALLKINSFSFLGTSLIIVISMLFDTSLRMKAQSIHNDKKFKLFGEV